MASVGVSSTPGPAAWESSKPTMETSRPARSPRSAFVCASDTLAMGVLHTRWIRQLAPGRDIGVVGFDDSLVAQVYPVGLTSVRQPLEDVAVEVVRTLRALLTHQPVETRGVLLEPTLAIRQSS